MSYAFTLIELLVTLAIVAILSAIAVPQYASYKRRAYDVRAQTDLRNVATAEEAYFLDSEHYLSCQDAGCSELPGIRRLSKGVELSVAAEPASFIATATHPLGSGRIYVWDSEQGGMQD